MTLIEQLKQIGSLLKLEPDTKLLPSSSTFRRLFQQVEAQAWVDSRVAGE
ncbi:hypothetical protein ACQ4M3_18365 [Leptolyngbya sp. AN03gr2]